ncbi:MAG: hypothetical protein ACFE9C_02660 [Candidatus Hodarchaeota archaeon]
MSMSRLKRERIAIYVDCILGTISAIGSLSGIIFVVITEGLEAIEFNTNFIISLTFWICWLLFSLSLIGVGLYKYFEEKNPERWKAKMEKRKKKLEPPIL